VLDIINSPLPKGVKPITLGPAESFYATITNSAYAALLIALPVILYQVYAFVLPAFSPTERRVALPLLMLVAGAVHRRRGVLLLRGAHPGAPLPAELQRRPVQRTGARA